MTRSQPPRLAVALLHRFVPDNEPLVGDLLEEFRARQSALWFWRQVIRAILVNACQNGREIRPLKLVEADPTLACVETAMTSKNRRAIINLSGSPIRGIGGLSLVFLGVLITLVIPQAWWFALWGALGGVLLGLAMVIVNRRRMLSGPNRRNALFGRDEPDSRKTAGE